MKPFKILLPTLFFVFFISYNIFSQWIFDTVMPYDGPDTLFGDLFFTSISIVDSSVSWVGGDYSRTPYLIYIAKRNVNGWREIKNYDIDSEILPSCIFGKDSLNAWIGTDARLYHTSNGGTNWILQIDFRDSSASYVDGITFSNLYPDIGYVFMGKQNYNGVYIFKTINSGLNWNCTMITIPNYTAMGQSLSVIDSNYAWFGLLDNCNNCYDSKLIMTSNGGINWYIINVNSLNDPDYIQFSDDKITGLYISTDFNSSIIFRTTNSGYNWQPVYSYFSPFYSERLKWVHGTSVIYLSNTGDLIKRSINNGITWSDMYPPFNSPTSTVTEMDAVKINNSTIYGLALIPETMNNPPKVYKLLDTSGVIGIEKPISTIPTSFNLYQNYPNPFNPKTKIKFNIPLSRGVSEGRGVLTTLIIYDLLGREVAILVNKSLQPGVYEVEWDASKFASGIYFYQLKTKDFIQTKKMLLIK